MYSEYAQRSLARKHPVCGCRIPNLHALMGGLALCGYGLAFKAQDLLRFQTGGGEGGIVERGQRLSLGVVAADDLQQTRLHLLVDELAGIARVIDV